MPYLRLCSRTIVLIPIDLIMITISLYIFIATNNNSTASLYQIGTTPTRLDSNTVTFRDGPVQWAVGMAGRDDYTRAVTVHDDVSLDAFFARPIPIYSFTLTPAVTYGGSIIFPWSLFLANVRVANRMSNYRLFSGKMKIKIMINGNGFYYGRFMASYAPYYSRDIAARNAAFNSTSSLMQNSQRLKIFLDPSESQGGEMELPFLWHFDMIDLTTTDPSELGALTFEQVVGLKHANAAVSPITVSVFAWMEDVKLSVPTATDINGIAPQAGDEYGSVKPSGIASAVASAAGALSNVPMIGPYMRATSMAAGTMSSVAKMFGFSRPTNLAVSMAVKQRPIGELAVTDTADGSVKLTVDSKQELSIDPGIAGLPATDQMSLCHIACIESLVNTFTWTTSATSDSYIANIRVTPCYADNVSAPGYTIPACCFAAQPFKYWRGTMRYRFMIVASAFHKGRLKFTWDPIISSTVTETNVQYTKIVDISNERDFVIDVAWGNPKTFLNCDPLPIIGSNVMRSTRYGTTAVGTNGALAVTVLNELTTPNSVANNDIQILVFMSMCDDCQFAAPTTTIQNLSIVDGSTSVQSGQEITPQADVENGQLPGDNVPEQTENTEEFVPCNPAADATLSVYFGESINSLRQLIKRYAIDYHYASIAPGLYSHVASDFPMKYGYTYNGFRGTTPNKFDKCNTTMMRYCAFAFLFYRGGVRRKYVISTNSTSPMYAVAGISRNSGLTGVNTTSTATITTTTALTVSDSLAAFQSTGLEGTTITTQRQNQVVEAEIPFYRNCRFALCRRPNSYPFVASDTGIPFIEDLNHTFQANIWTPSTANVFTSYVAGAEDATFMCFQGCAPLNVSPVLV
jgi:hypothetical protein